MRFVPGNRWTVVTLSLILAASIILHLYRVSYPDEPVFDEAHFATYAADYYTGTPFFDIHPPLGKLLYAEVLRLVSYRPAAAPQFVKWQKTETPGYFTIVKNEIPYGNFPYVPLRLLSCLFGVLLPLVFYFFLRNIGMGRAGALLAAFFVVFENALLLQTRLILMDGMYLVFGLAALSLYFSSFSKTGKWRPLVGGIFFGLSIGIKLIGVVFLFPVLLHFYMQKKPKRTEDRPRLATFFFAGSILFFFLALGNNLFFSVHDRLALWQSIGLVNPGGTAIIQPKVPDSIPRYLAVSMAENFFQVSKNIEGTSAALGSPWYLWPLMKEPILYYRSIKGKDIVLRGNSVIWLGSSLAVVALIVLALWRIKKYWRERSEEYIKTPLMLLGGYIGALLPFFTIVHRATFLYHYFPALLFSIGIAAWCIEKLLKLEKPGLLSSWSILLLGFIVCITIGGFIRGAPLVFGF
jgi:dolichyl-phosphate-mannose--protein O-mannosyl transferase